MSVAALVESETSALAECETVINRGLDSFIEVGNALLRIRDERLYRAEFGTFQEYCEERWNMSRVHAHHLISAAEVAGNLLTMVNKPSSERVVRPLVKLAPDQQRAAWQEAVAASPNGKPTANEVAAVVTAHLNPDRIRPISAPQVTEEQQEQIAEAENDSPTLFQLKFYWRKAGRGDRRRFREWIEFSDDAAKRQPKE